MLFNIHCSLYQCWEIPGCHQAPLQVITSFCSTFNKYTQIISRLISNVKRALFYIVPCIVLAVLLNFSKFFETETVRVCMDFTHCGCGYHTKLYVRPTKLRLSQSYIMWYTTWTWVMSTSIIPFFTLLSLNILIYRKLKDAKKVSARVNALQTQVSIIYQQIISNQLELKYNYNPILV